MTVVPSGRYLKIVESSGIEQQPIPFYGGGSRSPTDDRYVTRMYRVGNVSAEDVGDAAQSLQVTRRAASPPTRRPTR